jgi:cytochrome c biogenesis protein CcmG/thiol:disulfide interchange protein DsbE
MTDLLVRLRAVNPVPTCDPPPLEDVWRKLERDNQGPGRDVRRPERAGRGAGQGRSRVFSRTRRRVRHVGLGLAVVVPVLVAAVAIVLLGHHSGRPAGSSSRPAHRTPRHRPSTAIDEALARGAHPIAPKADQPLPILGSSQARSLESFRGKVVVLNVFASWCDPCRDETAQLEQAQVVIAGQGATVLGVTYEDKATATAAFVRHEHITYPVLRDPTGQFVRAFGLTGVPETFVIDPHGRIVAARRFEADDLWLTQTLARAFPSKHLVPSGLQLKPPPAASELAAMAQAYPVLRRRQHRTDIPPKGALGPYVVSQGGLATNTRRAVVTPQGESLYIVPAHQALCVVSSDNVTETCQAFPYTAATPTDLGVAICAPNLPPSELEVAGLMPPGASDITAHYSNGSSRPLIATDGMIAIYAPFHGPLPTTITWTGPHGAQRTSTGVPPNAARSNCASTKATP